MTAPPFPFSAVVGTGEAKLALLLATVDPGIGGVLLRGDKGAAKSTLARGLAALAPGSPFVELPLGATEERVVGSLDLAAALTEGEARVQLGLLAAAHGGVLHVDEVNLLADHLVDVLLDVAASGTNRVERDGTSHEHPARFVLVGSMNPEEGDLRPQLLDRFGLAVDVRAPAEPAVRAEAVRRRLAFDADPEAFAATWRPAEDELRRRLGAATPAPLDDATLLAASEVCVDAGAEGLRADLVLARAAAARAGWRGRDHVLADDVRAVAPLVLAHRARRHPLDPPGAPPPGLDEALDRALGPPESPVPAEPPAAVRALEAPRAEVAGAAGRRSPAVAHRGRTIGAAAPTGPLRAVAPVATVAAAAARWAGEPDAARHVERGDLREPRQEARTGNLLVVAVDASGSMGAGARMAAVKGALLGLLVDAYQRRDRVALVTFGGDGAQVVLRPTGSVEVARARLEDLPTGGPTPLAEGITTALDVATRSAAPTLRPLLVLVTDGRATGPDGLASALAAAAAVGRAGTPAVVVDVEPAGPGRLGLAAEVAAAMAAPVLSLPELTAAGLGRVLRLGGGGAR